MWHRALTKTYCGGSPSTRLEMVEGRIRRDRRKQIGSSWKRRLWQDDCNRLPSLHIFQPLICFRLICIQITLIQRAVDPILCCLALYITFASSSNEGENGCKMLLRIWALFSSPPSLAETPLLFFLSYPRVTAVERYDLLLSLLYLHVAYVLIKPTSSLFSAYNCRSKHPFWQFGCPLCHLEGARRRQLAVRGALGSIW